MEDGVSEKEHMEDTTVGICKLWHFVFQDCCSCTLIRTRAQVMTVLLIYCSQQHCPQE
jgi:hypothetical protein